MENFYYLLAINLSLLTFYLGVLIYALPIPERGIKKWSSILIKDSILSFIIIISIYFIYNYMNNFANSLGGSWSYFDLWFSNAITLSITTKALLMALSSILTKVPLGSQMASIISPMNDALTAEILFLAGLWGIYFIVSSLGQTILMIGLVLYSIPFRIARDAGAWFISFILVFSVGLQIMPVFITNIAESSGVNLNNQAISMGLTFINAKATYRGNPLKNSLIYVYTYNNSYNQIAIYKTDDKGNIISPSYGNEISLPSQLPSYFFSVIDGVAFKLYPFPLYPYNLSFSNSQEYNLYTDNILYENENYTLAFESNNGNYNSFTNDNLVYIYGSSGFVEIRAIDNCINNISYSNFAESNGTWNYYNLKGIYYVFTPINQNLTSYLKFKINNCMTPNLNIKYSDYANDYLGIQNILTPSILEYFLLYYITIPLIYFSLLISITYGLARLLGGRRGIIPRVI
ncbi:MAG: hypothetical protein RXQ93_00445 [Caldisphaera sp.]|jgi:hypothetical protein